MRIVLLAVDDEFAGEMQRFLYQSHPDWIVGSVLSTCKVYKHSDLGAAVMVLRKSGFLFLANMTYIKMLKYFHGERETFLPSQLAKQHGVEEFKSADINNAEGVAKLRSWNPDIIISTNFQPLHRQDGPRVHRALRLLEFAQVVVAPIPRDGAKFSRAS